MGIRAHLSPVTPYSVRGHPLRRKSGLLTRAGLSRWTGDQQGGEEELREW